MPHLFPHYLRLGFALACAPLVFAHQVDQTQLIAKMTDRANALLESLNEEKREAALIPFGNDERENFHYVPLDRQGALYKNMTAVQRANTLQLLHTALSDSGSMKAVQIMQLESILAEIENDPERRDPEKYWIAIFGTPGELPWGWRFEGHHLSVNQTITQHGISGTPLFMGANPGKVLNGPHKGKRVLADAEDRGRKFLLSLSPEQQKRAIIAQKAIREIKTGQHSLVEPLADEGIPYSALNEDQQRALEFLVRHYLNRHETEISEAARQRIDDHGWQNLMFAWAGPTEVAEGHYYRIQGPTFVIEYANTQNDANHHHTTYRDFENDFGRDTLREHYRHSH
ncbi:MAG: DUF3500 domain-containing protein [Opitutaceae bacterium]|jgi:hypothetical protein|nr:DUF3500 domain-containing protein [Opitutaceae bacterium]